MPTGDVHDISIMLGRLGGEVSMIREQLTEAKKERRDQFLELDGKISQVRHTLANHVQASNKTTFRLDAMEPELDNAQHDITVLKNTAERKLASERTNKMWFGGVVAVATASGGALATIISHFLFGKPPG